MKIAITILLSALILFLVQPVLASQPNAVCKSCCSKKETKKKPQASGEDCNPFVNCCYRTFEVIAFTIIKNENQATDKPTYLVQNESEQLGFTETPWHPPCV